MPTPTPLPYALPTAVSDLLTATLDPSTGVQTVFTSDLGVLIGTILGVVWVFYLLRYFNVLHRR